MRVVGTSFNIESCWQNACGSVQFTLNDPGWMRTAGWVEISVLPVLGLVNCFVGVVVEMVVKVLVVRSAMQRAVFTCWTKTVGQCMLGVDFLGFLVMMIVSWVLVIKNKNLELNQ